MSRTSPRPSPLGEGGQPHSTGFYTLLIKLNHSLDGTPNLGRPSRKPMALPSGTNLTPAPLPEGEGVRLRK